MNITFILKYKSDKKHYCKKCKTHKPHWYFKIKQTICDNCEKYKYFLLKT